MRKCQSGLMRAMFCSSRRCTRDHQLLSKKPWRAAFPWSRLTWETLPSESKALKAVMWRGLSQQNWPQSLVWFGSAASVPTVEPYQPEEPTSELHSRGELTGRLLLENILMTKK